MAATTKLPINNALSDFKTRGKLPGFLKPLLCALMKTHMDGFPMHKKATSLKIQEELATCPQLPSVQRDL